MDRRIDWHKDWLTEGLTDRRIDWQKDWLTEGLINRRIDWQKDWRTEGLTDRRIYWQKDLLTEGLIDRRIDWWFDKQRGQKLPAEYLFLSVVDFVSQPGADNQGACLWHVNVEIDFISH